MLQWLKRHARLTLAWWRGSKPTSEQMSTGVLGGRPIQPLEWYLSVVKFGLGGQAAQSATSKPDPFGIVFEGCWQSFQKAPALADKRLIEAFSSKLPLRMA